MKIRLAGLALVALVILVGCDDDPSRTGTYNYTAFVNNNAVVQGTIQVQDLTSETIRGQWQLNLSAGASANEVGPQLGSGNFEGSVDGDSINVNLNPGVADNNVFIQGAFDGDTIRGQWNWSGFPGVITQGTFIAEHQN